MLVKIRRDHAKRLHKDGRLVFISMRRNAHKTQDDPPILLSPLRDFNGQAAIFEYQNAGQGRGQRANFFAEDTEEKQ